MHTPATQRLLFVDDDAAVRRATTRLLALHGIDVVSATSGANALTILESQRFDAYLLDVELGDMNGVELMQAIRDRSPEARIGLWSGSGDLGAVPPKARASAAFVLIKGTAAMHLVASVRELFGARSLSLESCSR
jgi:DNA-binding NtrC family response regulator